MILEKPDLKVYKGHKVYKDPRVIKVIPDLKVYKGRKEKKETKAIPELRESRAHRETTMCLLRKTKQI